MKTKAAGVECQAGLGSVASVRKTADTLHAPTASEVMGMRRHACCFSFAVCLLLLAGCGLEGPVPRDPQRDDASTNKPGGPVAVKQAAVEKKLPGGGGGAGSKPGMLREKAAVGMGEKGRGYGGDMISVSVMALWNAKQRIVLDQMHHALELYKATEGHLPKTQEEFMEKIIKANNLKLPELPPGQHYVYDPKTGELMVEKPNNL